jgi:hypothetical protein
LLAGSLTSPACPADPTDRQRILTAFEFHNALTHGALADPGRIRDGPQPTVTQQPGLGRQRQPLLALVQMRQQHLEPRGKLTTDLARNAHTRSTRPNSEKNTLIFYGFPVTPSGSCPPSA